MAYGYPLHASSGFPVTTGQKAAGRTPKRSGRPWHYHDCRRSRVLLLIGAAVSAGIHLLILFGFPKPEPPPAPAVETEYIALIAPPPLLKELEEPEMVTSDSDDPPPDFSTMVPMQADLPALARPDDFVQALDYASLVERPEVNKSHITIIPEHISRGIDLRAKIGSIFNIADLDRPPEAILQTAPTYPFALKREGTQGSVRVEFVVDSEGRVHNPFVIESTHAGFEEAAIMGVSRWKFRPGIKNGRKVNARMQVPIVFKIAD